MPIVAVQEVTFGQMIVSLAGLLGGGGLRQQGQVDADCPVIVAVELMLLGLFEF
jgi:hypothetical protein